MLLVAPSELASCYTSKGIDGVPLSFFQTPPNLHDSGCCIEHQLFIKSFALQDTKTFRCNSCCSKNPRTPDMLTYCSAFLIPPHLHIHTVSSNIIMQREPENRSYIISRLAQRLDPRTKRKSSQGLLYKSTNHRQRF